MKLNKQAFTLIELLVVVLIIGILAAVALPQYTKAVEKARLAEILTNVDALDKAVKLYRLTGNEETVGLHDLDVELGGCKDEEYGCSTKNASYVFTCGQYYYCDLYVVRADGGCDINSSCDGAKYIIYVAWTKSGEMGKACMPMSDSKVGEYICKGLESQGYQYEGG